MGATGTEPIHVAFDVTHEGWETGLRAVVEEQQPALIVVDPLQRLVWARDLNDYAEMAKALDPLLRVARDTEAHVLMVHHARKGGSRGDVDSILGSTAILGTVDTALVLDLNRNERTLSTRQRSGPDLQPTRVDFDPESQRPLLTSTTAPASRGDELAGRIVGVLANRTFKPTERELFKAVPGRTEARRKALRDLVEEGRVERQGKGTKGDPYRYTLPGNAPAVVGKDDASTASERSERGTATESQVTPAPSPQGLMEGVISDG
jgi:hypothetical protein